MKDIDFSLVKAHHAMWNIKLNLFLNNSQQLLPETCLVDARSCYFGKWLYAKGLVEYRAVPEMRSLEKVHQQLHISARKVVEVKQLGNLVEARQELANLELLSQELLSLFNIVEQKIKQI